jgi:flagellar biosynthesis/type III secretory pathway protein FliH
MPDAFVPMRAWLDPATPAPTAEPACCDDIPAGTQVDARCEEPDDLERALADARRFRAALLQALECAVAELRRDIAIEILGRELELRDADLAAVVARACARYGDASPVRVRAHPAECALLPACYASVGDPALRRGDVVLEVREGEIDATLGARLQRVLDAR